MVIPHPPRDSSALGKVLTDYNSALSNQLEGNKIKQFQVPVKSVHHLVPTRNPHVGKAPRNKARSGVVPSLRRRCWSAVTTQEAAEAGRESSPQPGLAQLSPASLQLH